MKDTIKAELRNRLPQFAEGHVCIDLTDPLTGKVKERIKGKNHIFMDTIFSQALRYSNAPSVFFPWTRTISMAQLLLTDSTTAINNSVPYILGVPIGTGIPTQPGTGTIQGAYNAANQKLAIYNGESVYWKFQYDFTTAQANGSIGTIGLSYQNGSDMCCLPDCVPSVTPIVGSYSLTNDGRYAYVMSNAGAITKYDLLRGTNSTIDKSAVVGNNGSDYKKVGFDPSTGYYYIFVHNQSTAANRKVYRFSDNTFATLLATYTVSNAVYSYTYYDHPVYMYGNYMFLFYAEYVYICDYINNTAFISQAIPRSVLYSTMEIRAQNYSLPFQGKYVHLGEFDGYAGVIYDLQMQAVVAWLVGSSAFNGSFSLPILHPNAGIPCTPGNGSASYAAEYPTMYVKTAIAAKKLDTPVVKTTANGMTVTYELEVMY